jgi:hypothetical protein
MGNIKMCLGITRHIFDRQEGSKGKRRKVTITHTIRLRKE